MMGSSFRRWVLLVGAVVTVVIAFNVGLALMAKTMEIFDIAKATSSNQAEFLVQAVYPGIRAVAGWLVFGLVMTNATIIVSAIGVVLMLSPKGEESPLR
jgi:hypothetical protein